MKHVFYFLALSSLIVFSVGCGNDDDGPSCTQEQFLGVYAGTETCGGSTPGVPSGQYTITAGTSGNTLVITDEFGITYNAEISGCSFSWGTIVLGTGEKGSGSIDGNTLTLRREIEALGASVSDCNFSGTK